MLNLVRKRASVKDRDMTASKKSVIARSSSQRLAASMFLPNSMRITPPEKESFLQVQHDYRRVGQEFAMHETE